MTDDQTFAQSSVFALVSDGGLVLLPEGGHNDCVMSPSINDITTVFMFSTVSFFVFLIPNVQPTFVQWNFFQFNVLEGRSALYGSHPWHW